MKIKRIMLISLLLLALITITAVNATEDNSTTETLTIEEEPVELDSADEMPAIQEDEASNQADEKLSAKLDDETIQGTEPDIQIRVNDTMEGEDVIIEVTAPNDATGNITITVSDNNYVGNPLNGKITFLIQGLAAGAYAVTATYSGDATYDPGEANAHFKVLAYTFAQLRESIDLTTAGETLTLQHDYTSDGYPIEINKAITINGNGHTIDAQELSALFYISSDDCTLANMTLANANTNGSAITITSRNSRILNCTIVNFTAYTEGGAINWNGEDGLIANTTFTNCTSMNKGGAVYFNNNGEVRDCIFNYNTAMSDGGAVYFNGNANVMDCFFTYNFAKGNGGAFYLRYNGNISNSKFTNNAANNAGAIYMSRGSVEKCDFLYNSATQRAGAVIMYSGNLTNCTISNNNASDQGGAIVFGAICAVIDCNFENNKVSNSGGAIHFQYTGTVINSNFTNNTASGDGGAVYFSGTGTVTNCNFTDNTASSQGGAIRFGGSGTVSNCNFTNNSARYGGAVYSYAAGNLTNCNFIDNIATADGGAVYFNSNGNVIACCFTNNTAAANGGAVYFNKMSSSGYTTNVDMCIFTNNTAKLGGAMYNADFKDCIIEGEGNQVYPQYNASIELTVSNIIVGDVATIIVNVLPRDATGFVNITVTSGGDDFSSNMTFGGNGTVFIKPIIWEGNVSLMNGTVIVQIPNLAGGIYTVVAAYSGDDKYANNETAILFEVHKLVPEIYVDIVGNSISITSPDNLTGYALFTFNSINYTVPINSTVNIKGMFPGEYQYICSYSGDENYSAIVLKGNIIIPKWDLNITHIFNPDDGFMRITYPEDLTSPLTLIINGGMITVTPGTDKVDLTYLEPGSYMYSITCDGDGNYTQFSDDGNITVTKALATGELTLNNTVRGETSNITVTFPQAVTGMVNFIIYNPNAEIIINATADIVDGRATYAFNSLNIGQYMVSVIYMGGGQYYSGWLANSTFNVMPNMNLPNNITAGFTGQVSMDFGTATGNVKINVDDVEYASLRISGNRIDYTLPTDDLPVGKHYMTFDTLGSSVDNKIFYYYDEETGQYVPVKFYFDVTAQDIVIVPTREEKEVSTRYYDVVIENSQKEAAVDAKGTVTFNVTRVISEYVNETFEVVVEVVNGIARLDLSKYSNGNYIISWAYSGDTKYGAASNQVKLAVKRYNPRVVANDLNMLYSSNQVYSVTVYGTDGKAAVNTLVTFYINNAKVKTVTTNSRGVASIAISKNPGSYKITSNALGVKVTKNLKVNHVVSLKKVKVKRSAKKLVLTATLKKVNGKYVKGKKVTFKFNGKKFKVKTNKKGVAKLTIKKKVLKKLKKGKKVTYQATYLKDTVKYTVRVKK